VVEATTPELSSDSQKSEVGTPVVPTPTVDIAIVDDVADTPCVSLLSMRWQQSRCRRSYLFPSLLFPREVGISGLMVLHSLLAIWLLMVSGIFQK